MNLTEAIETSIAAAIKAGVVDERMHAAPIEGLRMLAKRAESADPEKDNVTLPTMLKYLAALNMLPEPAAQPAKPKAGSMRTMRDKFKAFDGGRAANG